MEDIVLEGSLTNVEMAKDHHEEDSHDADSVRDSSEAIVEDVFSHAPSVGVLSWFKENEHLQAYVYERNPQNSPTDYVVLMQEMDPWMLCLFVFICL